MEIKVGQTATATRVFDLKSVEDFAALTGDYNPVHFDAAYAADTIFGKPIVHGPLVITLVTTLFAHELPGPGSIYLSQDVRYIRPVYHGIFIRTICVNQDGDIVIEGLARLKKV
jgi:acyl dehydratase